MKTEPKDKKEEKKGDEQGRPAGEHTAAYSAVVPPAPPTAQEDAPTDSPQPAVGATKEEEASTAKPSDVPAPPPPAEIPEIHLGVTVVEVLDALKKDEDFMGAAKGDQGERGLPGLAGVKGKDGKSAPSWPGIAAIVVAVLASGFAIYTAKKAPEAAAASLKNDSQLMASFKGEPGAQGDRGASATPSNPEDVAKALAGNQDFVSKVAAAALAPQVVPAPVPSTATAQAPQLPAPPPAPPAPAKQTVAQGNSCVDICVPLTAPSVHGDKAAAAALCAARCPR